MLIESNRLCADCSDPIAVNVNLNHMTFVCANCSVIHRDLGHTIKNTATDSFTPEEIEALQSTTNAAVNQIWLATKSSADISITHTCDTLERRHFLERKYLLRQWYGKGCQKQPQEMLFPSDISTDQSVVGSPLPQITPFQDLMGPMWEDWMGPQQIGGRPPEDSWQMMQPVQRRKQTVWAQPQQQVKPPPG
jgi:hypothetical protein